MIAKAPVIGSDVKFRFLAASLGNLLDHRAEQEFMRLLAEFTGKKHIYLLDSGLSCFYVLLKCMQDLSARDEVVLPAYTAPSLVVAIAKAGLKPVLCDISLKDFNADLGLLREAVNQKTLAVLAVHMFGIGTEGLAQLAKALPEEVYLIEDCAQSLGSLYGGKQLGGFSRTSFYSFNRGKNLSIGSGGFIATSDSRLAGQIGKIFRRLEYPSIFKQLSLFAKTCLVSWVLNPRVYFFMQALSEGFKQHAPAKDIHFQRLAFFQAALGKKIFMGKESIFRQRYENGMFLLSSLSGLNGVICPAVDNASRPVFNRFPVVFRDTTKRELIKRKLQDAGVESSNLYHKPLHRFFDLGYRADAFPNAGFLADGLLTLPVYPGLEKRYLEVIPEVIRKYVS
ncbi:MAG: DegT/DnrJ/EryC1/StrS family aminotransferase [Candidatus Omnitrophota bacterium]